MLNKCLIYQTQQVGEFGSFDNGEGIGLTHNSINNNYNYYMVGHWSGFDNFSGNNSEFLVIRLMQ